VQSQTTPFERENITGNYYLDIISVSRTIDMSIMPFSRLILHMSLHKKKILTDHNLGCKQRRMKKEKEMHLDQTIGHALGPNR
jgi:hypothetical protein